MTHAARVLVVEDHAGIAESLRANLEIDGHHVDVAADGALAMERCVAFAPDLVILDLRLPVIDGFEVLRRVRAHSTSLPVMVLSARGAEADKLRGFALGADDYVTKPFALLELLARVRALLRRGARESGDTETPDVIGVGDLVIDIAARTVRRAGREIALRAKEFDLLATLARRAGRVISKRDLLQDVWGYRAGVISRTVDTHILELRRKLEDDTAHPRFIHTVRGAGYVLRV